MVFEVLNLFLDLVIILVGLNMKTANNQPAERHIRHWAASEIIFFISGRSVVCVESCLASLVKSCCGKQ